MSDPACNLLLITADNQPASLLGCYGNPDVETPHQDRIAREGMMFANSFAVNGMCSPCRATIFTGLLPSRHGVHSWLDDRYASEWPHDWCAISEFRSLPSTLARRGYQTAMVGKYHLGQPHAPMPGFDEWLAFDLGHTVTFYDNIVIDKGRRRQQVRGQHLADFFTERAVEYITHVDRGRPFFLNVNYNAPYLLPPTNLGPDPRNRFYERYVGRDFKSFPRTAIGEEVLARIDGPDDVNDLYRHHRFNLLRMHNDPASMANVCAQVTLVDDGIGHLLEALESRRLAESTLVVVTSDQANLYGQHGLWGQTIETNPSHLYDAALRNPLLFWHPEHLCTEVAPECLIGQYDLAPTLLDYLGYSDVRLDGCPGSSFATTLRSGVVPESWLDAVFFEQEESRGIRTADFAYWTRIPGTGPPVLFDQQSDPDQNHNVAGDPRYEPIVDRLNGRVSEFFQQWADPVYDPWVGGRAKGSVARPEMYRELWGGDWAPICEERAPFSE